MKKPHAAGSDSRTSVPFREGLFAVDAHDAYLIGNRCQQCNQLFFPAKPFCFSCLSKNMEPSGIGRSGTLYSFTTCHMPSGRFKPPYQVGWIDLQEGVRIFAPLKVRRNQTLEIGMRMELVIDELWREGKSSIIGYKYKPSTK